MSELLPCPFCGWDAKLVEPSEGLWRVECDRCGAQTATWTVRDGRVAAWNRRVIKADASIVDEFIEPQEA